MDGPCARGTMDRSWCSCLSITYFKSHIVSRSDTLPVLARSHNILPDLITLLGAVGSSTSPFTFPFVFHISFVTFFCFFHSALLSFSSFSGSVFLCFSVFLLKVGEVQSFYGALYAFTLFLSRHSIALSVHFHCFGAVIPWRSLCIYNVFV